MHLVCHSCGSVVELPSELMDGLATELSDRSGFALDVSHLALSGLCAACQDPAAPPAKEHLS